MIQKRHSIQSQKSLLTRGMNRLASFYDFISFVFSLGQVQKSQNESLKLISDVNRICILGGGSGQFLDNLEARHPEAAIDFIELSEQMLSLAKEQKLKNTEFILGDEKSLSGYYSLIILPFVLNCYEQNDQSALLEKLSAHLKQGSQLLIVDLNPSIKSLIFRAYTRLLYSGFKLFAKIPANRLHDYKQVIPQGLFLSGQTGSKAWFQGSIYKK